MEKTIKNDRIKAVIADGGAELVSLVNLRTGEELLWQADPEYWGRHAPLLFPNVGKQFKNQYTVDGVVYPSERHGFARDGVFTVTESKDNAVTLVLESVQKTKEIYPFTFSLAVEYRLEGSELKIIWRVKNVGEDTMYFTIGAHPAFNTFPKKSDYCLYFPDKTELKYHRLDTEYESVLPETFELELRDHRLHLTDELFEDDALVFDDYQIRECTLEREPGESILTVMSPDFFSYGIWSKIGAPFICLEPWCGRADDYGFTGELREKTNIVALAPGKEFEKSYSIVVC